MAGFWNLIVSSLTSSPDSLVNFSPTLVERGIEKQRQQRQSLSDKKRKKDKTGFNPKVYNRGWEGLTTQKNMKSKFSERELKYMDSLASDDKRLDIIAKAKMVELASSDIFENTILTEAERKLLAKEENGTLDKLMSYNEFLEQYKKEHDESNPDLIKVRLKYNEYKNLLKSIRQLVDTFGSIGAGVTDTLNKSAQSAKNYALEAMQYLVDNGDSLDDALIKLIEHSLDSYYNSLIRDGKNEADVRGFPLTLDEIMAHSRMKTLDREMEEKYGGFGKVLSTILDGTRTNDEVDAKYNLQNKKTVYEAMIEGQEDLYKSDIDEIKNDRRYNADNARKDILDIMSDNQIEWDANNKERGFKIKDDDKNDFVGIKGFNSWAKEGYLDDMLKDKLKLEHMSLMYEAIRKNEGEYAAREWLANKVLHEASEGMGSLNRFKNAGVGFVLDVVADAIEVVGGTVGIAEAMWDSAGSIGDDNFTDEFTKALKKSFDNKITRYGHDLSSTGAWTPTAQNLAAKAFDGEGLNYNDMIVDPEKANNFFAKYGGGFGIDGFLADTFRQASHTMFSVWAGKGLGWLGGKVGAGGFGVAAKMFRLSTKSVNKALKIGKTAGTWAGLAAAGSNEGIVDGIDVHDDVVRAGELKVDDFYTKTAISEYLDDYNINVKDLASIAQFLDSKGVGVYNRQREDGTQETVHSLLEEREDGTYDSAVSRDNLLGILLNSEFGKLIIEEYKNRPEVAAKIEEEKQKVRNRAVWAGLSTAAIENYINGSIRNHNQSARANVKAQSKKMAKLLKAISVKNGKVAIDDASVSYIIKGKIHDAAHEALEEGSQAITSSTFTSVADNNITDMIYAAYDPSSWSGFLNLLRSDFYAGSIAAGNALMDLNTYEAAVAGAIGSLMGFLDYKKGKGIGGITWSNSIFTNKSALEEENKLRQEFRDALLKTINEQGGIQTFLSINQTSAAFKQYDKAKAENKTTMAGEFNLAALIRGASTLDYIRDTEYGKFILNGLDILSKLLGTDIKDSDLVSDELLKARREKAKELLTSKDGEISEDQKVAIDCINLLREARNKGRKSAEEILNNASEDDIDMLLETVETANRTMDFVDKIHRSNAKNKGALEGLNFVGLNAYNVATVLLQDLEERFEAMDKKIRSLASPEGSSNPTLSSRLKSYIARYGNFSEKSIKKNISKIEKDIKALEEEQKIDNEELNNARKDRLGYEGETKRAVNRKINQLKKDIRDRKERISQKKLELKEANSITFKEGASLFLYANDILALPAEDRARMLAPSAKKQFSKEQRKEIEKVEQLLRKSGTDTYQTIFNMVTLEKLIKQGNEEVGDLLKNPNKYEEFCVDAQQLFRTAMLDYRYEADTNLEHNLEDIRNLLSKLDSDVELGLITKEEKELIITKSKNYEALKLMERNENKPQNEWETGAWDKYEEILREEAVKLSRIDRGSNWVYDKEKVGKLFSMLRDNLKLLEEFNNLSTSELEQLINDENGEINPEGNPEVTKEYIKLAALILNEYKTVLDNFNKVDNIDSENITLEPEKLNDNLSKDDILRMDLEDLNKKVKRTDILLNRSRVDGVKSIGSTINRIISYLSSPGIQNDETFGPLARALTQALEEIGMSDQPIKKIKDLYALIENRANDVDNEAGFSILMWNLVRDNVEEKRRIENAQQALTHGDSSIAEAHKGNSKSMQMETMKVGDMRLDATKKPLIDFLERYNFRKTAQTLAQINQKKGTTILIYYVTDSEVTQEYKDMVGGRYKDETHLPIFACVKAGDDYKGPSMPVNINGESVEVIPIGVLSENTERGKMASGFAFQDKIRNLAINQLQLNPTGKLAITVDGNTNSQALRSAPGSYRNFIRTTEAEYTERKNLFTSLKNLGEDIDLKVNYILDRLSVKKIGSWKRTVFKNENFDEDSLDTIVRGAFMTELEDFSSFDSLGRRHKVSDIVRGEGNNGIKRSIDNPLIKHFYGFFNSPLREKTISTIIGDLTSLEHISEGRLKDINDEIDRTIKYVFFPANYQGSDSWKFQLDVPAAANSRITLRLVPDKGTQSIELLDITDLFRDNGEGKQVVNFTDEDVNKILYNMIFDENGDVRARDNGSTFCTVQISRNLTADLTGSREGGYTAKGGKNAEQVKEDALQFARGIFKTIMLGGGMMSTGPLDLDIESIVLLKPDAFNPNAVLGDGTILNEYQRRQMDKLGDMKVGSSSVNDVTGEANQVLDRGAWLQIKKLIKNGTNKISGIVPRFMSATRTKGVFGTETDYSLQSDNKTAVATTLGTNVDSLLRHFLWSRKSNSDLKRIPITDKDVGDNFFTDEELEKEFGMRASDVRYLTAAFQQYVHLKELAGWYFVTDVIKPKANLTITETSGSRYNLPVSGELDLYAIDEDGNGHIIDFKTKRVSMDSHITALRSENLETRETAIRELMEGEIEGYNTQLDLYAKALQSKGLNIASIEVLAIPVWYPDDETLINENFRKKESEDTMYDTELLEHTVSHVDEKGNLAQEDKPFLGGLELYNIQDANGLFQEPIKLTSLELPMSEKLTFNAQNLLKLGEEEKQILILADPRWGMLFDSLQSANKKTVKGASFSQEEEASVEKVELSTPLKPSSDGPVIVAGNDGTFEEDWDIPPAKKVGSLHGVTPQGLSDYTSMLSYLLNARPGETITMYDSSGKPRKFKASSIKKAMRGKTLEQWDSMSPDARCEEARCKGG